MGKKKTAAKKKTEGLSFQLVLAGCGGLLERLNTLMLDAAKDPLDKFNVHCTHISFTEGKDDFWSEYYLIQRGKADLGWLKIEKEPVARVALISFYLTKEHRNQGVLTETVPFVGNRVFRELGFNKLRACAWETNGVAISIYERWLKQEGVIRAHGYYEGNYVDFFQYGCLYSESDFQRTKQ